MRVVAIIFTLLLLFSVGCNSAQPAIEKSLLADKVGQNCTVQFRRGDGLGAGGGLPVSPTTGSINGAQVNLSGKLKAVSGGWIELENGSVEYCIPRESILLVEFSK